MTQPGGVEDRPNLGIPAVRLTFPVVGCALQPHRLGWYRPTEVTLQFNSGDPTEITAEITGTREHDQVGIRETVTAAPTGLPEWLRPYAAGYLYEGGQKLTQVHMRVQADLTRLDLVTHRPDTYVLTDERDGVTWRGTVGGWEQVTGS